MPDLMYSYTSRGLIGRMPDDMLTEEGVAIGVLEAILLRKPISGIRLSQFAPVSFEDRECRCAAPTRTLETLETMRE